MNMGVSCLNIWSVTETYKQRISLQIVVVYLKLNKMLKLLLIVGFGEFITITLILANFNIGFLNT